MGLIALISNGVVASVIVAEPDFLRVAELDGSEAVVVHDGEHPGVGWTYAAGVFTPPVVLPAPVVAPAAPDARITRLAFRNRFTTAEKIALYNAAKTSVEVQIYLDDVNAASYIDLQRPDTRASVQHLESLGLIAPGRALGILDSPIQDDERLDN